MIERSDSIFESGDNIIIPKPNGVACGTILDRFVSRVSLHDVFGQLFGHRKMSLMFSCLKPWMDPRSYHLQTDVHRKEGVSKLLAYFT